MELRTLPEFFRPDPFGGRLAREPLAVEAGQSLAGHGVPFAVMKRGYQYRRVRYRGLVRNRTQLLIMCIATNLRRALILSAA